MHKKSDYQLNGISKNYLKQELDNPYLQGMKLEANINVSDRNNINNRNY